METLKARNSIKKKNIQSIKNGCKIKIADNKRKFCEA